MSIITSARGMFTSTDNSLQKDIALRIFNSNLVWLLILLNVLVIILSAVYKLDGAIIGGVSSIIGVAIGHLWSERKVVVEFLFGSSLGSQLKNFLKK